MRYTLIILTLIAASLLGAFIYVQGYPARQYEAWLSGKNWSRYFEIQNYRPLLLTPVPLEEVVMYQEDYPQLWKVFPLGNSLIPLPTRHPLFQTIAIVDTKDKKSVSQIGMAIHAANGLELSRIYAVPPRLWQDHSHGQDLFKLPYVRNRILNKDLDTLWKDLFSNTLGKGAKTWDDMIYDLYLLHLRSKLLPEETVSYGLTPDGKKAMIELQSRNADYTMELVMNQINGTIYSYVIRTEKNSTESNKLRSKFIETISFSPTDEAMGRILYTEFKQLNFARQVDQEGMLYLFASWTQDPGNQDIFREMIFYLERGRNTNAHLKPLYQYAFKRFGKSFTTRQGYNPSEDAELKVQRNMEIEEYERKKAAELAKSKNVGNVELSPDEKMNSYLKKAKEEGAPETKDMTIH